MQPLTLVLLLAITFDCSAQELRLYGGDKGHHVALGCLTCGTHDAESVCNKHGEFGSRYGEASIWNSYGPYGSKYSNTSPWNKYASNPPVIVDPEGNFYGYLTANKYHHERTTIEVLSHMASNVDTIAEDLENAREWFCQD